ncbi:11387_t:CDS:2, partial [Funneliformis caledonium]
FRLPDIAIDMLIKFVKHILTELDHEQFKNFSTSLYTIRKKLGLKHQFVTFFVCSSCHKLHNIDDVKQHTIREQKVIKKCDHIQFPNNHHHSLRKCDTPLSEQKELGGNKIVNSPLLIYPMATDRNVKREILCDIYDGEIWKNFLNSGIVYNANEEEILDEEKFFNKEHADDHLGIMINVDWFQPFERTVHSSSAIYGIICNLPRKLHFNTENMLILGLMLGPNEASLYQINHYLAPIVDQLLVFWNGIILEQTFEHSTGRLIKCAVIAYCCDIPAARKLCGHISANVYCHRCIKVARNRNFSGIDNIDEWFIAKDANEYREAALKWRKCKNNEARKRH